MANLSSKTIERLIVYRRLLKSLLDKGLQNIYSHQLAENTGFSAAQVRRDLMVIGYTGSPTKGYNISELLSSIFELLDPEGVLNFAVIGMGNLARAVCAYLQGKYPRYKIVAGFDVDPYKVGRVIAGVRCCHISEMGRILQENAVRAVVLAVPAEEARRVAELAVNNGVRAILNFSPTMLSLPADVYVEYVDIGVSVEKVAYFAKKGRSFNTGGSLEEQE